MIWRVGHDAPSNGATSTMWRRPSKAAGLDKGDGLRGPGGEAAVVVTARYVKEIRYRATGLSLATALLLDICQDHRYPDR